jgi:hypothetical protein
MREERPGAVKEKAVVKKLVDDESSVYFTIFWSPLEKCDKYDIISRVPSEAGIFELYSKDRWGKLNLFHLGKSWYGGLRNELRARTDPELETDAARRSLLENNDCYYRYSLISNSDDMTDILYFFANRYFPVSDTYKPSGNFATIFVKEVSSDKIVTI